MLKSSIISCRERASTVPQHNAAFWNAVRRKRTPLRIRRRMAKNESFPADRSMPGPYIGFHTIKKIVRYSLPQMILEIQLVLLLSFLADIYKFDPDVNFAGFAVFVGAEAVYRQDAFFVRDDGDGVPVPLGELLVDEPLF